MTIGTFEPRSLQATSIDQNTRLTVRAHSTCEGAHVHVGSLRMLHNDVSAFAGRYQQRPDASMLAKLTASAVNDIQGVLARQLGLRIHRVEAVASCEAESLHETAPIALDLWIESPEPEAAVQRMVDAWEQEFARNATPNGRTLQLSVRVVNWYGE